MNSKPPTSGRLGELDALRGLAALAVLVFHYSVRYPAITGEHEPIWAFAGGQYGVAVFFAISGFVILMTLERCQQVADFLVSRVSRLYPAYWASLAITALVVAWLGLPGREVTVPQLLLNLTMVQGAFYVPHVDGVYWSLGVELIFYGWMLLLFVSGHLAHIRTVMLLWLLASLGLAAAAQGGLVLPERLTGLLLMPHIAMFALGVLAYRVHVARRADALDALTLGCVVASAWAWGGQALAWVCLGTAAVWALFVARRLGFLACQPLLFLGAISYPLYLLHQNIGYAVMRALAPLCEPLWLRAVAALGLSLLLASAVTYAVERPAMRWVRQRYALNKQMGAVRA